MENLKNKEIEILDSTGVLKPRTKSVEPKITPLEQNIINKSNNLNIPALCAFFGVTEDVVKAALAKK
jgi:hypothetical protein